MPLQLAALLGAALKQLIERCVTAEKAASLFIDFMLSMLAISAGRICCCCIAPAAGALT
jgi:hypothetical protein